MSALRERMERAMAKDAALAPAPDVVEPKPVDCTRCPDQALYDGLVRQGRSWYHTWECHACGERRHAFVKEERN